ncbi:hypothetical protein HTX81_09315 [Pseudomonas lini]|uniref:hypothetical protein n=1 Tax=Pseudomonas lini TaxID=163011 RepID=UPI00157292C4|nr:hypothetical protein [Pseudomonas lini]NSX08774.1 hypothetical protein [Pseudomonas lini]
MSKPAKIFFLGVVVCLVVLAVGYLLDKREQSTLDSLIAKCKTETMEAPTGPWQKYQEAPLVCEPTELLIYPDIIGIQKEVRQSYLGRGDYFSWSQLLAVLLMGVFVLPYAWYFLLRRVRELVKAITGK